MALPNIFTKSVSEEIIGRINALTPSTQGNWGKMSASQMLAHCSVSYELIYENKHPKPNAFMKFILKLLVKSKVVSEEPYPQNGQTAPQFVVKEDKDFEVEKNRLINYIRKTQELGENYFDGKESHSFGALNITE